MYVRKLKKPNDHIYLLFVQSYREAGKPKSRTVKSLGYLDELAKQFDDLIAHFEEVARTETEKTKAEHAPVVLTIPILSKRSISGPLSARTSGAPCLCQSIIAWVLKRLSAVLCASTRFTLMSMPF